MTDLTHTVFVYRRRSDGKIVACYLDQEHLYREPWFEHVATLNPSLWVAAHWDEVEGKQRAREDVARELERLRGIARASGRQA